jgi:serine/threonine protein kinase
VDIVTALQFLHVGNSNKMIKSCFHRDVKSANTVLKRDLTAQLIDCGLATFVVDETNSRRSSLDAKGTPGYICPEYSAGEVKCFDCACDIYSFGVVLVELWTGKLQNCADDNGDAFNFTTQYIKRQEGKTKRDIKVDADSTFGCDPSDELPAFMIRFVELAVACIRDHDVIPDGKDVLDELVAILRSSECAEAGMSYTDRV